jgi:hypothetical protein
MMPYRESLKDREGTDMLIVGNAAFCPVRYVDKLAL